MEDQSAISGSQERGQGRRQQEEQHPGTFSADEEWQSPGQGRKQHSMDQEEQRPGKTPSPCSWEFDRITEL